MSACYKRHICDAMHNQIGCVRYGLLKVVGFDVSILKMFYSLLGLVFAI